IAGVVLWATASVIFDVAEPWDSPRYWLAYLLALAVSGLLGFFARSGAWLIGALVVFAQLPVMVAQSGAGPLIVVGVLLLGVLSLPAMLVAMIAARLRV